MVLFHALRFRDLKSFYLGYVCHMHEEFLRTHCLWPPAEETFNELQYH
ncbi:MAG: hypothetical protein J5814_07705 [Bacteroidaceae bacterium]|nr:hypothetical protein [Bacteroidaceae bacterium]